jgi:hypothetical protein
MANATSLWFHNKSTDEYEKDSGADRPLMLRRSLDLIHLPRISCVYDELYSTNQRSLDKAIKKPRHEYVDQISETRHVS